MIRSSIGHHSISISQKEIEETAKSLLNILMNSIRDRVSDLDDVALAFSGGLDSSIIAMLAKNCNVNIHLISVGLENQSEILQSMKAAEALELPLYLKTYDIGDVSRILPKVIWLIEEPDPVKISIAIPLYWVAELAAGLRYNILLTGQGSDELFGGYQKYLNQFLVYGAESTRKTILQDISLCYDQNFQRDNQICSFHKVELRLPFFDSIVVDFALDLPMELLFFSDANKPRKRILRKMARTLNIPAFIASRPKKAIQYSTGVNKALKKLAKKSGLSMKEFTYEVFDRVFPEKKTI
jgi:asparagine synthase (glutamine-hydrolysing)